MRQQSQAPLGSGSWQDLRLMIGNGHWQRPTAARPKLARNNTDQSSKCLVKIQLRWY